MTTELNDADVRRGNGADPAPQVVAPAAVRLTFGPGIGRQHLAAVWWPRSRSAARELPELIAAASSQLGGPVTRVSLNIDAWDAPHDTRLSVAGRVVRLGWFHHIDPHLVTAGRGTHDRTFIAVLPADIDTTIAECIMDRLQRSSEWPTTTAELLDLGGTRASPDGEE